MLPECAAAIVRAWTRIYTWRLPPDVRDARRAELESDLWEFQHDPRRRAGVSAAAHILIRCLAGVPDDLCWRHEHRTAAGTPMRVAMWLAAAVAIAMVLTSAWVIRALRPMDLPTPPAVQWFRPPSPPPPPPPPPRPARDSRAGRGG